MEGALLFCGLIKSLFYYYGRTAVVFNGALFEKFPGLFGLRPLLGGRWGSADKA